MATIGVVRAIDPVGRIVIPREYRRILGLTPRTEMEIALDDNGVISLKKYFPKATEKNTQE